jgi:putative Ca2+/H+ antiporter (TMEM165/GDT1 family)
LAVFVAAASALVLGTAVSVGLGTLARNWLDNIPLKLIAGIAFILIGVLAIVENYRGT